jgi:hypothetical protein
MSPAEPAVPAGVVVSPGRLPAAGGGDRKDQQDRRGEQESI